MTKRAMLKTTLPTLRILERALRGYTAPENGLCYLLLSGGNAVKVSVAGMDISPRFECFFLAIEASEKPAGTINSFATQEGRAATFILVREEFTEPFTGDPTSLLGRPPHTTQRGGKPGHVPEHALDRCLVAYGILFESDQGRLAIVADWFPYKMVATTDEAEIDLLLSESEPVPFPRYMRENGFV